MSLKLVSMEKQITDPWGRQSLTQTVATSSLETSQETLVDTCANNWERAIRTNNFNDLQQLLASEPHHINRPGILGMSPLLYAIQEAKTEMVHKLLTHKDTDIELPDQFGTTPLIAAVYGNSRIIQLLLEHKANPLHQHPKSGETPLMYALASSRPQKILEALLLYTVNLTDRASLHDTRSRQWTVINNQRKTAIDILIANSTSDFREQHIAVALQSLSQTQYGVQLAFRYGLKRAAPRLQLPFIPHLAKHPYLRFRDFCYDLAVSNPNMNLQKSYVQARLDDQRQESPWFQAIHAHDVPAIQNLLERHPEMLHQPAGILKMTPLLYAIWSKKTEIAKLLVNRGSDITQHDILGYTPLRAAIVVDDSELATILVQRGAQQTVHATNNNSDLMVAILCENLTIFRTLINQHAQPRDQWTCQNKNQKTAVDLILTGKTGESSRALREEFFSYFLTHVNPTVQVFQKSLEKTPAQVQDHYNEFFRNYLLNKINKS